MKKVPTGIMHKPKNMAWAELTPAKDIKALEKIKAVKDITEYEEGNKKNPLPVSKATTLLRRAYPYIFDCVTYCNTHAPDKFIMADYYKSVTMPADIFFDYCLGGCNGQRERLKDEIYKMLIGDVNKAKYIKINNEVVYGQPIIITLIRTNPETGKEERIYNLGHDQIIDRVQVLIFGCLLSSEQGYLNVPKAFYAKTRQVYDNMRNNIRPLIDNKDSSHKDIIKAVRSMAVGKMSLVEASSAASICLEQAALLQSLEQGGFYEVFLGMEYILINRRRGADFQEYGIKKLCSKCKPEYVQEKNGKYTYKDKKNAFRYALFIGVFIKMFDANTRQIIGIERVEPTGDGDKISVFFIKRGKI
jgi:hypothetical protein